MSRHVSEWLSTYHDGELRGSRLREVESHLAECGFCQAELKSLESLSRLLDEVPAPELSSPERFASQVNLRLPHQQVVTPGKRILEISWWVVPVGLTAAWVFVSTSSLISGILSAASGLGVLSGISDWIAFGPASDIYLSATLAQSGLLSGNGLSWIESIETLTRTSLPLISLQVSIALLYLGWIAVWWVRHTRREHGQLLEG
jgi:predicted anti-sigma-YlaC factor YlaD